MQVLVVGGAGYIGSHMVKLLDRHGCAVTVLDNLSAGYRDAVKAGRFVRDWWPIRGGRGRNWAGSRAMPIWRP
jgi:nucleoside-diphosphate-sugar epimerase